MDLVLFRHHSCHVKPVVEWQHWVCPHLQKLVTAPGSGGPMEVQKILLNGNKSSEIYIFVRGPISDSVKDEMACDKCWATVYPISAL